ncbi:Ppx/GppA family phosphatase [bacterium]|nr:Ppx/GppA family phosphatase [bacterium]
MRRAVIDIGTNTVKLLVADVDGTTVRAVHHTDCATRLGEGASRDGQLRPGPIAHTAGAVAEYGTAARHHGAEEVRAVTTSAAREASNSSELLAAVRDRCGIEVRVLSGDRESELIYRGVISDPAWADQPLLVIDVGGGSAEFIQGTGANIERHRCLSIGAVRLLDQFGEHGFAGLCQHLRTTLHRELQGYNPERRRVIGTGGTAVTLARIAAAGEPAAAIDHAELNHDAVRALVTRLDALPLPERRQVPGLPPERADIIVPGGLVFVIAMELLRLPTITVSTRGLRHGVLVAAAW